MTDSSQLKNINYPKRTAVILVLLIVFALTSSYFLATLIFLVISFIFATIILDQAVKILSEQREEQRKKNIQITTTDAQREREAIMKEFTTQLTNDSAKPLSPALSSKTNNQLPAWENILKQAEQTLNQTKTEPALASPQNKVSSVAHKT